MRQRMYRLIASALATLFLVVGGVSASSYAPQGLPAASEIIARYIEVIGGAEAIRAHSSSHARGTMELLGQGIRGEMHIYSAAPAKSLLVVNFADLGIESRTGYNGEIGWQIDPITGERILQGNELLQVIDESDYYADLHEPAKFESMDTVGTTEFAGRATYKVKLVYMSGREVFEYFDIESGRLAGIEGLQHALMGAINVRAFVSEYRSFGGVLVPTKIVQELAPGQTVQLTISSVEHNTVDPAVFALPASIEALVGGDRAGDR